MPQRPPAWNPQGWHATRRQGSSSGGKTLRGEIPLRENLSGWLLFVGTKLRLNVLKTYSTNSCIFSPYCGLGSNVNTGRAVRLICCGDGRDRRSIFWVGTAVLVRQRDFEGTSGFRGLTPGRMVVVATNARQSGRPGASWTKQ